MRIPTAVNEQGEIVVASSSEEASQIIIVTKAAAWIAGVIVTASVGVGAAFMARIPGDIEGLKISQANLRGEIVELVRKTSREAVDEHVKAGPHSPVMETLARFEEIHRRVRADLEEIKATLREMKQ